MIPKFYKIDRAFIHMKYSYALYLSNISILFFLYQTEVLFELLMIEVRISDLLRCFNSQKNLIQNIRTSCGPFFFLVSFYNFLEFNKLYNLQRCCI